MSAKFFAKTAVDDEVKLSLYGILALASGVLNGLIGTGGGLILLLILRKIYKSDEKKAFASVMAATVPMAALSAFIYCLKNGVNAAEFAYVIPAASVGGAAGAFLLGKLGTRALTFIFGTLTLLSGVISVIK